jgi:SAM-dependent methyltransferase
MSFSPFHSAMDLRATTVPRAELLATSRFDLVLELDCGAVELSAELPRRCLHWFGTHHSDAALRAAARQLRVHTNVTLVGASPDNLASFYDASFDLVYTAAAARWDRAVQAAAWREVYRLLRPGGRLVLFSWDEAPAAFASGWAGLAAHACDAGLAFVARKPPVGAVHRNMA